MTEAPSPKLKAEVLVERLQQALAAGGLDYQRTIDEFGQVRASEERAQGKEFGLREHIRGLVLSLLSNQRPWGPIAQNLGRIDAIFFQFSPTEIKATDPSQFAHQLRAIRCGNRQIAKQMASLHENIAVLETIITNHGSLDNFIGTADPHEICKLLSDSGSKYKLRQVGYTLAMEYLRNVGVPASKPDVHVRRAIGRRRLGLVDDDEPSEEKAYRTVGKMADEAHVNRSYLDNLLWLFCAQDYGNVCRAAPRCTVCLLRDACHYPAQPPSP
jgi:hypothetical protein